MNRFVRSVLHRKDMEVLAEALGAKTDLKTLNWRNQFRFEPFIENGPFSNGRRSHPFWVRFNHSDSPSTGRRGGWSRNLWSGFRNAIDMTRSP